MAKATLTIGPATAGLLTELQDLFRSRGVEAYVTGGFLRDALLGRDSHDVDISIAGDPLVLGRELADAFDGHYFPLAEEQHVARVLLPERNLHVDLLPLRAEIEADLRERDYTIDAMAAPLAEAASGAAAVIDPTGGRDDLRRRLVRVIREDAFRHDPLRPLRGARLAVELDFTLEAGTAELIRKYASGLPQVAVERQRDELMRILATPRAGQGLRLLDDLYLLERLLPEIAETRGVEQPKEHYWDVFDHCLETVRNLDILLAERPRRAVLKLGGLLHDIAKPETKTFDDSGRMRFFGHADVGAEKWRRRRMRTTFSAPTSA